MTNRLAVRKGDYVPTAAYTFLRSSSPLLNAYVVFEYSYYTQINCSYFWIAPISNSIVRRFEQTHVYLISHLYSLETYIAELARTENHAEIVCRTRGNSECVCADNMLPHRVFTNSKRFVLSAYIWIWYVYNLDSVSVHIFQIVRAPKYTLPVSVSMRDTMRMLRAKSTQQRVWRETVRSYVQAHRECALCPWIHIHILYAHVFRREYKLRSNESTLHTTPNLF